jgi:hypothetical protein
VEDGTEGEPEWGAGTGERDEVKVDLVDRGREVGPSPATPAPEYRDPHRQRAGRRARIDERAAACSPPPLRQRRSLASATGGGVRSPATGFAGPPLAEGGGSGAHA